MSWKESIFQQYMVYLGGKIHEIITVMSHCRYCLDTNMGEGKCTLRHITCPCVAFTYQLDQSYIHGGKES